MCGTQKVFGLVIIFIFAAGYLTTASYAQSETLDDILGGFEETAPQAKQDAATTLKPNESIFDLTGSATLSTAYNYSHKAPADGKTDYRGLSRLRAELLIELDIHLADDWEAFIGGKGFYDASYALNGRDEYTSDVLNAYEKEGELRDIYILGKVAKSLDIQIGRQVVVWGKSDNIRVTDILNPLDNREPGMVDIKDLRLPLFMTKLDYYFGPWDLSAIAIHEIRFNKNPAFGSDFYTFDSPAPAEEIPTDSLDNTEFALSLSGSFSGWDASFYFARIYDDRPHMERNGALFTRSHSRLTMIGTAANVAYGNWLIKTEAAHFSGLMFFNAQSEKMSRFDILAGVEYSGFTDSAVSLEAVNRQIIDYTQDLKNAPDQASENEFQLALRYNRDFMHDRLHIMALATVFGLRGEGGGFARISCEYDVSDSLSVTGGMVAYQSGEYAFFRNIGDNDRLFINLRLSF